MADKNMEAQISVEFEEATSRQSLNSGETINTLWSKVKRWLSDLKAVAFSGSYNDLSDKPTTATTDTDGLMSSSDKNKLDSADDTYALKSKYGDTTIDVGRKSETDVGVNSTAEGYNTTASGLYSHAEGEVTVASGEGSHAEGIGTKATGRDSHAEGAGSIASGYDSHAGGNGSIASGHVSFSHGIQTSAQSVAEVAFGQYNVSGGRLFSIGDGTSHDARHNAFEITATGGKLHDKDIATTTYVDNAIIDAHITNIPFIAGTQTATTGAWTGATSEISALVDGQTIRYWLPYDGNGNATLNLTLADGTTTGAIACYWKGTSRMTTHYAAGTIITLTYRKNVSIKGSGSYTGWWADADFDSNTFDRIKYAQVIKCGTNAIVKYNIIVGKDGIYNHLKNGTAFDITYPILYANSDIAASALSSTTYNNNYIMIPFSVTTTQAITLTTYKPVFIKGSLNGTTFTPVSTTPLTQTVPTSADGYEYILLGVAYNTTVMYLLADHPIFAFKGGAFGQISSKGITDLSASGKTITYTRGDGGTGTITTQDTVTTATTTGSGNAVTAITANNGALTVTKGATFLTAHPAITTSTDTTSTAAPAHGGTFTAVDSVTRDSDGHVTNINTKTITLPTDTKVTNTLATTTKAYITGTTSSSTNTGTQVFDTGVYLDTTAGTLTANTFKGTLSGNASSATITKKIFYAECATARNVIAKVINCEGFVLETGAIIAVRFTDTSTASPTSGNITLNINNTGAKNIILKSNNAVYTYGWAWAFCNNQTWLFVYNGTYFVCINQDNNTTYTPMSLGFGYGTCSTVEATAAKVASLTSYALVKNGMVSVKFSYAVPANSTLNINSRGAKNIFYRGAKITAGVINAGDIATFVYDGTQYQLISVDANYARKSDVPAIDSALSSTSTNPVQNKVINSALAGKAAASHSHTISQISDFPTSIPFEGGNADTVGGKVPEKIFYDNGLSTDLNGATQSGCYATSPDTLNVPFSAWWLVDTTNFNNQFIVQKAHVIGNTAVTDSYIRNYANGVWSEWKRLCDGGNADTIDGLHADNFLLKSDSMVFNGIAINADRHSIGDVNNYWSLWTDNEGGNFELRSPDKSRAIQMDCFDNNIFRIYSWLGANFWGLLEANHNTGEVKINGRPNHRIPTLTSDGGVYDINHEHTNDAFIQWDGSSYFKLKTYSGHLTAVDYATNSNNSNTLGGIVDAYHLGTFSTAGDGHGAEWQLYCQHNIYGDGRFGFRVGDGSSQIRCDYATEAGKPYVTGTFTHNGSQVTVNLGFTPSIVIWGDGQRCYIAQGSTNSFIATAAGYTQIDFLSGGSNNFRHSMANVPCYYIAFK